MSTELQESGSKELAKVSFDDFGGGEVSANDIVIPKVLVMQGLSKLVTEGNAKFGDLVDSLSSQVIGNAEKEPLEFIPFYLQKLWIVSKKVGDRYVFDHIEDVTAMNENKKWEEVIGSEQYKNEKSFNFYSILPSDPSIPYVIQFKSTSMKAGRELATQMYIKNKAAGLTPASKVMKLGGAKVSNDKGTYMVLKTSVSRNSEESEIRGCLEWLQTIKSSNTKVDQSDIAGGDDDAPAPAF